MDKVFGLPQLEALAGSVGKLHKRDARTVSILLNVLDIPNVVVQEATETAACCTEDSARYWEEARVLRVEAEGRDEDSKVAKAEAKRVGKLLKLFE